MQTGQLTRVSDRGPVSYQHFVYKKHCKTLDATPPPPQGHTYVVARGVAAMALGLLQGQDLEGGQGRGSRLGGDHAPEASHRPCPHVVVVGAHWRQERGRAALLVCCLRECQSSTDDSICPYPSHARSHTTLSLMSHTFRPLDGSLPQWVASEVQMGPSCDCRW